MLSIEQLWDRPMCQGKVSRSTEQGVESSLTVYQLQKDGTKDIESPKAQGQFRIPGQCTKIQIFTLNQRSSTLTGE